MIFYFTKFSKYGLNIDFLLACLKLKIHMYRIIFGYVYYRNIKVYYFSSFPKFQFRRFEFSLNLMFLKVTTGEIRWSVTFRLSCQFSEKRSRENSVGRVYICII